MLRRFWVEPQNIQDGQVVFNGESFHHLVKVSRRKTSDQVEVLDGSGQAYLVEITAVDRDQAEGKILETRPLPTVKEPLIRLAFCFPKTNHFELVLEKATELGAASVRPLISDFSQVKKLKDYPFKRVARWQKIIKSATEQSGRGDLMSLEEPQSLDDFVQNINQGPETLCLFFYEGESPLDIRTHLQSVNHGQIKDVWALVGAEGGFSEREVSLLKSKTYQPITLGQQILRTETACVSILSVLKYEFGLMR